MSVCIAEHSQLEIRQPIWWGTFLTGVVSDTKMLPTPLIISNHNFLRTIDAISPVLQVLFNNSIIEN